MNRSAAKQVLVVSLFVAAMVLSLAGSAGAISADRTMYGEGTGQALVYPFWVADAATDTSFEVVNRITPLVQSNQDGFSDFTSNRRSRWVLVHVTVHEEKNSEDVINFDLCLSPGDVWTGTLTRDGSNDLVLVTDDLTHPGLLAASPNPTNLPSAQRGYIEAVMRDNGTTAITGCNANQDGDGDFEEDDDSVGTSQPLLGRSLFVDIGNGLASGFNAEALDDMENDVEMSIGSIQGSRRAFQALAMGDFERQTRGTFLGRWLRDEVNEFETQVILTFPTGKNHLFNVCGPGNPFGNAGGSCGVNVSPFDFRITATTEIAMWIRNDEECVNPSPRKILIPNEVNVISFLGLPDGLFNTNQSQPPGECKNPGVATDGWFRMLFDKNGDEVTDFVSGVADTSSPFLDGLGYQTFRLPRLIPAVGMVLISAPVDGIRITGAFPFQSERPHNEYNCGDYNFDCHQVFGDPGD